MNIFAASRLCVRQHFRIFNKSDSMHISEGILSAPVLIGGAVLAVAGTGIGMKKLDENRVAHAGILSAAFFVASFIHVPVGPSSVHLVMNGIVGLLLGWAAFPAILAALILQAVLFQFGGITTLGVNTVIMAMPAVICHKIFQPLIFRKGLPGRAAAFGSGFLAVFLAALLVGLSLLFTEENFLETAALVVGVNLPVMVVEGVVTAIMIGFLKKVHPVMLGAPPAAPATGGQ
jgi:cobalt/nickel transport system permease protein